MSSSTGTSLFFVKPATRVVLLCAPQMRKLGEKVVQHTRGVTLGTISWKKFPDGFPNIFVHDVESIKGCHVVFLCCFSNAGEIFEQMSVLCSLPQYAPHSIKIILPFFPVGTMERVDQEGEIATARTLARILSSVPPCRGGPMDLVIYDIHALQERFYFGDNVIPVLESGVTLLLQKLEAEALERFDTTNNKPHYWTIAFPDMGAYMRYHSMFKSFDTVICMKVRTGDERKITVKEGNAKGKHCVLVDDLIQSGGTLIECGKALLELGAVSVSAFCTHAVFPNAAYRKFLGGPFQKVWITDSCPLQAELVNGKGPFEVLSLAPLIANVIDMEPSKEQHGPRLSRL
uniref:Phosphoribosyltransferase domain-containing protein n=1 Tax=Guillardia theta TaxID=55529 RepID=A0A7S4KYV8_GUITH|mmetsp:Transcript_34020/g.106591  ORF Transcript_34020/g.106591 Transcript_34020/m.106591 type:complete len:345 (+) Transcript_34020:43-1077(+)